LRDVSFEIQKGSVFCIIGENGSGKSTTLQLAAGIFQPTSGDVRIGGRVAALLELGAGFNPQFSGRENVFLYGTLLGLSNREIRQRYRDIEEFAEIGDFVNRPVKTYSSGMLVRLAFAVAINVDPEILIVDEALSVGDYYFRQRCMRKVHELKRRQTTIIFVSHSMADVKAIGSEVMWLEDGRAVEIGQPDGVVSRYLARMVEKDAAYQQLHRGTIPAVSKDKIEVAPEVIETIPNIDFRHGNKKAEILGIAALNEKGEPLQLLEPHSQLVLRISVRAKHGLASPNVGFMLRNHMGLDFAGTNTAREGVTVPPMGAGDVFTVDFHIEVPELYPGDFSFSPAIADGPLDGYEMCDWIENALILPMAHSGAPVYGYLHLPCRVAVNSRLRERKPWESPISSCKS
jgi:ABC-type polysaccharide/polyol phosphate transport system ATPase subunit